MRRSGQRPSIHVFIIEENHLAAEYLFQVLSTDPSIHAQHLMNLRQISASEEHHSILVFDKRGFDEPLSECIRQIRHQSPQARFIVLDQASSEEETARMVWYGVHGFLYHNEVRDALIRAVHRVSDGGLWFSPELLQGFMEHGGVLREGDPPSYDSLTSREKEVLELVKRRLSNKEIADILRIRESTVKFHLTHIFSKLQATTRRDLFEKHEVGSFWSSLVLPAD